MRALTPSEDLAAVIGTKAIPRTQVIKKLWVYIRKNNLQRPSDRRRIVADSKLKKIFGGKGEVSMLELGTFLNKHLS